VCGPKLNNGDPKEMFAQNLECFPVYIREQVRTVPLQEVWERVEVLRSDDGYPVCRYRDGFGHCMQINSINPTKQAHEWAESLFLDSFGALFLYGLGFGYALHEVLNRVHPDTIVVVFEQEIHVFIAMLHVFDLRPLFSQHHKCIFFIGDAPVTMKHFSVLLVTEHMYALTTPAVVYAPESKLFKRAYTEIHRRAFELLSQQVFARGNDHIDSLIGLHNMVENASVVLENPYLSTLRSRFQDSPIFIVANGPSLDGNVQQLKRIGHRGLILCCESAIVPLMNHGVVPDAIVVAERTPASYLYHFRDVQYPDTVALLALSVADPRTWRAFSGPKIPIFRNQESNSQWINTILADGEGLSGGINVSHLAFELAVYLGGDPVVFVGQDLAYGPNGATHSAHSRYMTAGKEYIESIQNAPKVYVQSNRGENIATTPSWVDYRKWLEQLIEENFAVTVINATEGGARIEGTKCQDVASVIEEYCTTDLRCTLHQVIDDAKKDLDAFERRCRLKTLMKELNRYVEIYRALKKFASETEAASTYLWKDSDTVTMAHNQPDFQTAYDRNRRALDRFLDPQLHQVFVQLPMLYGHHQMNRLGAIRSFAQLRDAVRIQVHLLHHLALVCDSLMRNFRVCAEKLSIGLASFDELPCQVRGDVE
jgi:hypothetical protein